MHSGGRGASPRIGVVSYVNVASDFGMPVSRVFQFFRATLLCDSIIMRLDKDTDPLREFVVYAEGAAPAAKSAVSFLRRTATGRREAW
jgi:hypothetical protein